VAAAQKARNEGPAITYQKNLASLMSGQTACIAYMYRAGFQRLGSAAVDARSWSDFQRRAAPLSADGRKESWSYIGLP
jgi:hypothetical protein